jgi:hypothetical protein
MQLNRIRDLDYSLTFLFMASPSDRSHTQEWALTQHICSPCVAESHIVFLLPKVTNIYFLLDSPTELLQQRKTRGIPFSFAHKKITIDACASTTKGVEKTLESVQSRAGKMIREEEL